MATEKDIDKLSSQLENIELSTSTQTKDSQNSGGREDCPVCILPLKYPVRLDPCGHVFCFLCIKGVCLRSGSCPLCRADISRDLAYRGVTEEQLLISGEKEQLSSTKESSQKHVHWYYEGYRGWWEYDQTTGGLIEEAHQSGRAELSVYLFGNAYKIDLSRMQQSREGGFYRVRKIKRSEGDMSPTGHRKGVAGIFTTDKHSDTQLDSNSKD